MRVRRLAPTQPPPHWCRLFPLLLVQNGVSPPLRTVSVAQKEKPSTMLSSTVQSIDLLMDCTAWRCWTTRQWNSCSSPAPRSSAAKSGMNNWLQTHKTVVENFVPGKFGLFRWNPWQPFAEPRLKNTALQAKKRKWWNAKFITAWYQNSELGSSAVSNPQRHYIYVKI